MKTSEIKKSDFVVVRWDDAADEIGLVVQKDGRDLSVFFPPNAKFPLAARLDRWVDAKQVVSVIGRCAVPAALEAQHCSAKQN